MTANSIPDLLAGHEIRVKRMAAGSSEKAICPSCHGGRTKELSLSVQIDADGFGATWNCKRGTCGFRGGERLRTQDGNARPAPRRDERETRKPPAHPSQPRPPALYAWAASRAISPETVDVFGLYVATHWFPPPIDGERPAIVFPYRWRGEVVNRKYRPPEKNPQMAEPQAMPTLFNVDAIETTDVVWWVEGEPDVLAMHEAGYRQTVTLKDGADGKLRDEDDPRREDDRRFLALATHGEMLAEVQKFVLAGDMDEPGKVLREELARRLGRHRCWLVTWPDGCKDAGDVLQKHGVAGVRAAVEAAQPYPIKGVQRITQGTLARLRSMPPPPTMTTGTSVTDAILALPAEGRLIVLTGFPGSGKSTWLSFAMIHTAGHHRRRWGVFSPENQPWEQYAAQLAEVLIGKPFYRPKAGSNGVPAMDDLEVDHAEHWLGERVTMLVSDAEDDPPTIDWLLDRAKALVLQTGMTDLVIDPWNEVEHNRGTLNETEYTGRCLQRLKAFGFRYGCNVWVVAHPAKPPPLKGNEKLQPPGLYEISGSSNWANKADLGLTIHSTEPGLTQINITKARFKRFGRKGGKALMNFDSITNRYSSPSMQPELDGLAR